MTPQSSKLERRFFVRFNALFIRKFDTIENTLPLAELDEYELLKGPEITTF